MAKNWWENDAVVEAPNEKWWEQDAVVSQPQGRRGVTPFKVDVQQPRQAAAAPQVSAEYSPSGKDFGSAFMLRPEFVDKVRNSFASVAPEKRRQALIDAAAGTDATAQAAQRILLDVQKEDKFLQEQEGSRQGMINIVRKALRVNPEPKLGDQPKPPVVFPDLTPTVLERADAYKTPESKRIANRLRQDEATRIVVGAETSLDAIVEQGRAANPQGYLSAAAEAGGRSLLAAGARLIDDLNPFTLSESDAATLFKNNPTKLNEIAEKSAAMALSRFANEQTARAREVMQDVSPTETGAISGKPLTGLEYATLDPEKAAYLSPTRVAGDVLQSLPTTLALAVSAYLTKGAATKSAAQAEATALANGAGTAEAKAAARKAAISAGAETMAKTGAVGEGAIGYAQQMNQSMDEGFAVKREVYETSPQYKELLSQGYSPEAARRKLVADSAREAGLIAGAVDAGTNLFGGRILGDVIGGGGKLGARVVKGVATEGGTETIQGLGEQFGENLAAQNLNPKQELTKGLGEAAASGLVVGGVTGGGTAAIFGGGSNQATQTPAQAFANAFAGDVAGAQFAPAAIDAYARRVLDVQSYDANIIRPDQTAKVQRDQTSLQQSTTAADAAAAADSLSGSLNELLVPSTAITPLPLEPTLDVGQMAPSTARAGPGFDASALTPSGRLIEPGLDLNIPATAGQVIEPTLDLNAPAGEINPTTEQQFGLDKLRINAPRPQSIQGTPVDNLSNDQLQAITGDESVAPISRRSAAIELNARQGEAGAFTQRAAPQQTAAPSTVSFTRTMTPEELGAMPIRDRRALASQFDQTENEDGTITFTTKPGVASSTQVVSIPPLPGTEQTLGTTPVRDVGNQPVLDNETVRADAQRSLDRWAVDNNQAIPAKLNPAPDAETRAVGTIANLLGSQFGARVIAFHDTQPRAVQGVAVGGTAFVNTANVVTDVSKVSLHELKHTIEQIAFTERQAGLTNTSAQKFTAQIESIFDDITEEGKRAYITNFLHADELAALDSTPDIKESRIQEILQSPVLRSEMTADFMGNRATDKAFWADVAQADPGGFKGFVQKWVSVIDNLMATLRGKPTQGETESAKVDQYVRDLGKAKMVAREALIAYRQGTLQQFESAPAASLRQGEINAPTIGTQRSENLPGPTAQNRPGFSQDGGGPTPTYGTARAGAISVVGRHYSTTPRQTLSGAYYGQGLKGAERTRLDNSTDPRLKNRVYFYVDQGAGIRPESGVGGYAHEAKLDNIYDPQTRLIKPQADANAFESAVINAGFDGYIAPFGNGQSAVVLLGQKHKAVPVKQIGQPQAAALPAEAAPTTLKKGLLSREASQVDTGNIPGSRMRMGTLEIPVGQVEAANTEMERIGSQIRFSKKELVGPPAPQVKDTGVYRDVADKLKMSAAEYNASMLPLMTGKTGDKTFKTPNVGGIPEVVQWLDQRRAATGLAKLDINKPADRTALAKLLAGEAVAAIRSAGNAVEWYDETVAKTLRIMAVKYPELNSDPNARNAFLMATAISSQTMNVEDNLRYASQQYEAFRTTGKFPEVGTGKSAPAMAKNFKLANELLADMGPDQVRRFLASTFTKRELEMSGFKIGGESMDEKLLGSAVFGPKIGFGFYSNLTGNFEPVTMDMWFMRTVGRLAGTLPAFDPVLFPKQVAKLRAALAETGPAERGVYGAQFDPAAVQAAMETDEGAIALARQVSSLHNRQFIKERAAFDSGTRIKTALVGAADSIIKSSDKPTDAPGSGGERQKLRDVVRQMVAMVEEQTGKRVPPAALQALIWYPEQELYKNLGVKLRVTSQDYAGAAESLLKKEGFDGQQLRTAAESGPGPARQVAGKPIAGTNQANGGPTGGAVPLKGKERDTFLAERTARVNAQSVAAQPLQAIFESLDKRGLAKTRAEAAFTARPDGAQIKYVQENFNDILIQLEDADKVKINCK